MHVPPAFRNSNTAKALAFAREFPFAALVVNGEHVPVTALVPLVYDAKTGVFLGHVARINPFWKAALATGRAAAIFRGPDAYVTPSSYLSKARHHKAVPTWNYRALEIRGKISVEIEPEKMERYLSPLTEEMESRRAEPWSLSEAPKAYLSQLSRAIVGFSLSPDSSEFIEKLSQNKSEADQQGVIRALELSGGANDMAIAAAMRGRA